MVTIRSIMCGLCIFLLLGTGVLAQEAEQTPSEKEALQAYRKGAFSRAVELYKKALSETQDGKHRAELQVRIAWTLFALGRESEVDLHLKAALVENNELSLLPDYYTQEFLDLFELARRELLRDKGNDGTPAPDLEVTIAAIQQRIEESADVEGALADVDRLLQEYPEDGRLIPIKIDLLERLERYDEANKIRHRIEAGGAAGLMDRLSITDLILRANQLLDDGDADGSLELLREAVSRQPSNVAALEMMAQAAGLGGRWQEAEFALKSALALQPDNIGLKLRLAEIYLATSKLSAARDIFRQLTRDYPQSDRAWAALGLLDAKLGNHDRAKDELAKALEENPLLPEVQLAHGELLLLEGSIDQAIEALRSAANLLQEDAQVDARLGQALLARQRPVDALGHLRAAGQGGFEPPDVERSLTLAMISNELLSEAQRKLERVVPDDDGDADILRTMILLERDQLAEAEVLAATVVQKRSNDAPVLNLLASALYRQARYNEAVSYLSQAHELAPENPGITNNLELAQAALAAEQLGQNAREVKAPPPSR